MAGAAVQHRWLHALDLLDAALSLLTAAEPDRFAGLSVRLLQPLDVDAGSGSNGGWAVSASRDFGEEERYQVALVLLVSLPRTLH